MAQGNVEHVGVGNVIAHPDLLELAFAMASIRNITAVGIGTNKESYKRAACLALAITNVFYNQINRRHGCTVR